MRVVTLDGLGAMDFDLGTGDEGYSLSLPSMPGLPPMPPMVADGLKGLVLGLVVGVPLALVYRRVKG